MNSLLRFQMRRLSGACALFLLLGAAGCLEKRLVWAPDGSRAAVISSDGLYICDAEGRLSPLLARDVNSAAWLSDSMRLVVTRHRETTDWAAIAPALGDGRKTIETKADEISQTLERGGGWSVVSLDLGDKAKEAVEICALARHGSVLRAKLSQSEWQNLNRRTVVVTELHVVRIAGEQLSLGPVLYAHYGEISEIRPSPDGQAVAWTQSSILRKDESELMVAALDGAPAATKVAARVAAYPDWDVSGRALVYVEAAPANEQTSDTVVLGVLTKRKVRNEKGAIVLANEREYLAGLLFNTLTHVRCLRDGRTLFNAAEMTLPLAAADYGGDQREQLFAIDPNRQSTLARLIPRRHELEIPQALAFFEVSPDERQVVFGGMKNEVAILTLATGEVTAIQEGAKDTFKGVPVWRAAGEITYVKRADFKSTKFSTRPAEIVLRRGEKEIVLSQTWPDEVLAKIAGKDSS